MLEGVNEYHTMLSLVNIEMQGIITNYDDYLKNLDEANKTFNSVVKDKSAEIKESRNDIIKALFNKVNKLKKGIVYANKQVKRYQAVIETYEKTPCHLLVQYNTTLKKYNELYNDLYKKFSDYLLDCISVLDLTTGDIFTDTSFKL